MSEITSILSSYGGRQSPFADVIVTTMGGRAARMAGSVSTIAGGASVGSTVATLADPFAGLGLGVTTYTVVGQGSASLALSNGAIILAATPQVRKNYITIEALAGDAKSRITQTIEFTAASIGGGAGPTPIPAPGYVATLSTPQYSSYGPQRLNAAYSGPLFKLYRSSDGATMDVSPISGGDFPSYATIKTWAGSSVVYVTTLYDQSGNGRNLTQATLANMPVLDLTNAVEGRAVPIIFDSNSAASPTGADPAPVTKKMFVATGGGINLQTHSFFFAAETQSALAINGFASFTDAVGGGIEAIYGSGTGSIVWRTQGGNQTSSLVANNGITPRSSRTVLGATVSATSTHMFLNGIQQNGSRTTASTDMGGFALGVGTLGSDNVGDFRFYGCVAYAATIPDADAASVVASLNTATAVPSAYDYRMALDTDSIMVGVGAFQRIQNMPNQLMTLLTKRWDIINLAISGQTLATSYANLANRHAYAYTSTLPVIYVINGGTNDISAGTTGANTYTTLTNMVAALKAYGSNVKVVVCTILPRQAFIGNSKETERQNYNALVIANSAGADFVLDLASNPDMGVSTSFVTDTTKYQDGTHPTALGYSYLSGVLGSSNYNYRYALSQVLGTTP